MVTTVNIHRTGAANSLTAGATEGKCGVDFVLNFDERIEEHWPALLCVHIVSHVLGLISRVVGIRPVDVKSLHASLFHFSQALVKLFCVVYFKNVCNVR